MTCIAGLVSDHGSVWIGGDSAGVAGLDLQVRSDTKVFRNGPFVMGFTSSFRMGQLLRYAFTPPDHDPRKDAEAFMVTTFIDAVRDCLKKGGYARKTNEAESAGTFLVGYRGGLYRIDSDYQVGIPADGYAAVGCGDQIALGALYASRDSGLSSRERVIQSLEAAERFSAGVRGPFVVERITGLEP